MKKSKCVKVVVFFMYILKLFECGRKWGVVAQNEKMDDIQSFFPYKLITSGFSFILITQ